MPTYRDYLRSAHWKSLRAEKHARCNMRCAVCGNPNDQLDTHHLIYRDLVSVQPKDLRMMCRRCHQLAHDLHSSGVIVFRSESHHHRFQVTKRAIAKHLGVDVSKPNFGNREVWKW